KKADQKEITGTVKNEINQPVAGVSVTVKGTSRGTITDVDGKFSLRAVQGEVLEFAHPSFQTVEISVGTKNTYEIILKMKMQDLSEVVITGYTNYKRDETASAVTTVKADQIEHVSAGSFNQILQGKVPGMHVTSSSGQPGEAPDVIIRGVGSIDGNRRPLYIMDGIPIEANYFQTINPNDIESVTVLKDASA